MGIRKHSAGSLEAETLRQKIGDEALLRAFCALVEDNGARAEFIDDLAAGAAGRAWNSVIVGNGNGANLESRTDLGDGGKDRGALGAVGHSVRCVLDVASCEHLAFRGEDGRAHPEVGKGGVGVLHHLARRTEQAFAHGSWDLWLWHIQIDFTEEQEGPLSRVTGVAQRRFSRAFAWCLAVE